MNNVAKLCVALSALLTSNTTSAGLIFNISSTGNTQADAGFQLAADNISSLFSDDLTVNITAGFSSLGSSILGQARSQVTLYDYASWKNAMLLDAVSADDLSMVNSLPSGSTFNPFINGTSDNPNGAGSVIPYTDNDAGANNGIVRVTRANAKALGLQNVQAPEEDAAITFSSDFAFDFDPTDGINAGMIDFVGVAMHEILHALGFSSGVDILDVNTMNGPAAGLFPDNAFTFVTGLDFTRHSAASQAAGADFDWTADQRDKYFSIDGGATQIGPNSGFSQGRYNGDGRQASHWKDNLGIGIMDPTAMPAGRENIVTKQDIQALDVIGWDLASAFSIPAPPVIFMFSIGLLGIFVSRKAQ
ncbi:NF038122 family metalloprotease [Flocculibacter collagenilyticus]|uniref:NF038122 family metalloprotease n=1 Tax=Flocculibacter collagenilyticus TaxID=2744479 RepID=UPI0018F418A8|nr:NF038122 family metalloprotease [Flocculibacter collagenilyticus]